MPNPVHVTRAADLTQSGGQTDGMIRMVLEIPSVRTSPGPPLPFFLLLLHANHFQGAITSLSPSICASLMTALPHSASVIHHHGPQDTVVYAASGYGSIVSEGGKKRQDLAPGDFALIPAYAEHQEVNDGVEEVVWVITRTGSEPVVVNLEGWGKS
jgi:mannose-6-phosphate isomerase-like protein (cupin superfamily)